MAYEDRIAGKVELGLSESGSHAFWTFDAVQERLVEAMRLWERSPGGGRWPFAGDAPWHLMTRATRLDAGRVKGMDLARLLQEDDERETRERLGREPKRGLTRDEIELRDEATEWLGWVAEADRRLVILVLTQRARGRRVSYVALKPLLGVEYGVDGLRKRYSRAISGVAERLNRGAAKTAAQ